MALITRYVNTASTAGGDGTTNATSGANRAYASLSAAEAALQQDLTDAGGDVLEIICEGTTADDGNVTVDGFTTNSSSYVLIKAVSSASAGRHAGIFSTSKYRVRNTTSVIAVRDEYIFFEGIQVHLNGTNGVHAPAQYCINYGVGSVQASGGVRSCIINGGSGASNNTQRGILVNTNSTNLLQLVNNIVFDCETVGIRNDFSTQTIALYNNTVVYCGTGITDSSTDMIPKNNLVNDCTTDYSGTFAGGGVNNLSEDGTHPGTSGQTATVSFVDEANDDFHLASGDTAAKNNGADLSADGNYAFSTDIDGETRSGSWDIGADEIVSAASVVSKNLFVKQAINRGSTY